MSRGGVGPGENGALIRKVCASECYYKVLINTAPHPLHNMGPMDPRLCSLRPPRHKMAPITSGSSSDLQVLGLTKTATEPELKKAYRKTALKLHPVRMLLLLLLLLLHASHCHRRCCSHAPAPLPERHGGSLVHWLAGQVRPNWGGGGVQEGLLGVRHCLSLTFHCHCLCRVCFHCLGG